MKTDELLKLAQVLASKYKDSEEYDDLVQEGVLAALDHEDQSYWAVHSRMRRAMSNYKNCFVATQITVPPSNVSKALSGSKDTNPWLEATLAALQGLSEATGDRQDLVDETFEEKLLDKEEIDAVLNAAEAFLEPFDLMVVKSVLGKGMSQAQVADTSSVPKARVSRSVERSVKILNGKLGE